MPNMRLTFRLFCGIIFVYDKNHREHESMTKQDLLTYCQSTYGTLPDYPFDDDLCTAVLRHRDSRKWYALLMRVSRKKFGQESGEVVDVVNMKLPVELAGSFGPSDGVFPAYHMNKFHWISVILTDAKDETVRFLLNASYEVTRAKKKAKSR